MSEQDSFFKEGGVSGQPQSSPESLSTPFSAPTREAEVAAQLKTAQRQLSNLMIVLLVVSGTLAIFLLQQVRYAKADLVSLEGPAQQLEQARQVIANYNQNNVPAMQNFMQQLVEYLEDAS